MGELLYTPHLKEKAESHRGVTKRQYLACGGTIDIHIITLKAHYWDGLYNIALVTKKHGIMSEVVKIASALNTDDDFTYEVREFVRIENNEITVAINVDKIDEAAEDRALMLLIEVEEVKDGVYQEFGDPVTFKHSEMI